MSEWGRIDDEGNVFVKLGDGEKQIGQWQAGSADEGLAMYTRRFDGLATEVSLLEQRLKGGSVSPDDAAKAVDLIREQVDAAQAIGDLASLSTRLDALLPTIDEAREKRREAKAARTAEAEAGKTRIVAEAEKIAAGTDWKAGSDRLRALLDEWKALPRLSKSADDALWHRFSSARSQHTRARKVHFGELAEAREGAAKVKEKLIKEAEALSSSQDWGGTARAYRDLMGRWKQAGPAPRKVEDALWGRFRAAQDVFFAARDEENAKLDAEYEENAKVKDVLVVEAEALLPIKDLDAARKAIGEIADRWEAAGKVPRSRMSELEGRMKKVEQAIRSAGEQEWKRTDPEKSARADDMVGKLERAIAEAEDKLAKAQAAGDAKKVKDLEASIAGNKQFLEMAQKAQTDFR